MPLDRPQKLTLLLGLPLALLTIATLVLLRGAPGGAPAPAPAPAPRHATTTTPPRGPTLTDQVRRNLRAIYRGVRFHHLEHGELPQPSSAITPPLDTCCAAPDRTCAPSPARWELEPWPSIGFEVVDPDPYSYSYTIEPPGDRFTIRAVGDPDCDGVAETRTIEGAVVGGTLDPDPVILP